MDLRRFARRMSKLGRKTALRGGLILGGRAQINAGLDDLIRALWPVEIDTPLVRVGGSGDGGYLVPDDMDGIVACFSPGVAEQADFELELAGKGVRSFLLDGSVAKCPVEHELIDFEPTFLDGYTGPDRISINEWIESKMGEQDGDLLLQMDIEGYEWPSLLSIEESHLKRFRIIVLEVHDLENIFRTFGYRLINTALRRLLAHFDVVHAHPNNISGVFQHKGRALPDVLELTFLRKDRVRANGLATTLPHPLDEPCVTFRPELSLYDALSPLPSGLDKANRG